MKVPTVDVRMRPLVADKDSNQPKQRTSHQITFQFNTGAAQLYLCQRTLPLDQEGLALCHLVKQVKFSALSKKVPTSYIEKTT